MSKGFRAGVVILTALAAICSLGIFAVAVARVLVNRFKKLNPQNLPQSTAKTQCSAIKTFYPTQTPIQPVIKVPAVLPVVQALLATHPQTNPSTTKMSLSTLSSEPAPVQNIPSASTQTPILQKIAKPVPATPSTLIAQSSTPVSPILQPTAALVAPVPIARSPLKPVRASVAGPPPLNHIKKLWSFFFEAYKAKPNDYQEPPANPYNEVLRAFLSTQLWRSLDKVCGNSLQNGDCFLHAFCQAVNVQKALKKEKDILQVSFARIFCGSMTLKTPWLMDWFKNNKHLMRDNIQTYFDKIVDWGLGYDPLPSFPTREGRILCEGYKLNLKIYRAEIFGLTQSKAKELMDDGVKLEEYLSPPAGTMGPSRCSFVEVPSESIIVPGATMTIEIVMHPRPGLENLYLPVFDYDNLIKLV